RRRCRRRKRPRSRRACGLIGSGREKLREKRPHRIKDAMKRRWPWILALLVVAGLLVARGRALTSHPTQPSTLGTPSSAAEMLKVIDTPGLITVETVASADWEVDR